MKKKFQIAIIPAALAIVASCALLIFFGLNVERWNASHDGIADLILISYLLICIIAVLQLFREKARKNKYFVCTLIFMAITLTALYVLSFLYGCPYCNDWTLSTLS